MTAFYYHAYTHIVVCLSLFYVHLSRLSLPFSSMIRLFLDEATVPTSSLTARVTPPSNHSTVTFGYDVPAPSARPRRPAGSTRDKFFLRQ